MTTAEYLGGHSIGSAIPSALQGIAAADAVIAASLPAAQAKLAGAIAAAASIQATPPSLSASVELAAKILAAAQVALTGPAISLDVSGAAAFQAEVAAQLGALEAAAALILQLKILFGTFGIHLYFVEGEIGSHGTALQGQLAGGVPGGSGGAQLGTGFYLVAADNGAIAALRTVFGA